MAVSGTRRVSTADQNPAAPARRPREAGADRIFRDHGMSGSIACSARSLDACLDHFVKGDVLTVWKLDRLGRSTRHVLTVVDDLTARRYRVPQHLTEGLHTDGPMGKAMLTIMAAFAQLERDTMIERTRAGLAAAAANGRKGGRPRKVDDAEPRPRRAASREGHQCDRHREDAGRFPRHRVPLPVRRRDALRLNVSRGLRCDFATAAGSAASGSGVRPVCRSPTIKAVTISDNAATLN